MSSQNQKLIILHHLNLETNPIPLSELANKLQLDCTDRTIRRHGVRIGGSTYIPFEDPKALQKKIKQIIFKAASIKDPFEQSLFLLIHISYIQAFVDVNKSLRKKRNPKKRSQTPYT